MRGIVIGGMALLCFGVIAAHRLVATNAPAATKEDSLVFVFRGADREHDVAILRPMIAPDIGVQLDSSLPAEAGPPAQAASAKLERGAVLHCHATTREHAAIVDGAVSRVNEMLLDCGDRKFVIRALDFTARR